MSLPFLNNKEGHEKKKHHHRQEEPCELRSHEPILIINPSHSVLCRAHPTGDMSELAPVL